MYLLWIFNDKNDRTFKTSIKTPVNEKSLFSELSILAANKHYFFKEISYTKFWIKFHAVEFHYINGADYPVLLLIGDKDWYDEFSYYRGSKIQWYREIRLSSSTSINEIEEWLNKSGDIDAIRRYEESILATKMECYVKTHVRDFEGYRESLLNLKKVYDLVLSFYNSCNPNIEEVKESNKMKSMVQLFDIWPEENKTQFLVGFYKIWAHKFKEVEELEKSGKYEQTIGNWLYPK